MASGSALFAGEGDASGVAVFLTAAFLGDADGDASAEVVFFLVDVAELVYVGFLVSDVDLVDVECVLAGLVEVAVVSCFL